ncbi:uncharacterized protein LOC131207340 [Anopheles bellator]|uniref:uncharacterized protein LOC131207340 n=1 Tax=Anopheles bellator TaxID=139047 RepID=UPI002647D461|nr:uncharacterized protein LOC131207340 [Anopheles bellator]
MALRLRKDVQKASYYVWFLGAQEAKALRGSRTLLPMIPRMVEKSKEQEPLKVTLQVSHKGLKIVQGSAKHFIPHGAITCSVQTEDVVACTLLLYNPATKCPLHVHAYRCDSELTAQALHDQLQILINRPENQKRYTELEARLGLATQLTGGPCGGQPGAVAAASHPTAIPEHAARNRMPRGRFGGSPGRGRGPYPDSHSQHGSSDTGTSTRESECSEEQQHSPTSPVSPLISQSKLYDSLAAELREKLSGGVPLLLPTKDYGGGATGDKSSPTGPDAASRRIRNGGGSITPSTGHNKHGVSSRGSSGIGSDLAPSPERHEPQSSSEDEWVNDPEPALRGSSPNLAGGRPALDGGRGYRDDPPATRMSKYREPPAAAYLYPNVREEPVRPRHQRSSSREEKRSLQGSVNSHEEEVRPIITNHTPRYRSAFKASEEYLEERRKKLHGDGGKKYHDERADHGGAGRRSGRSYPCADERPDDAPGADMFDYRKPPADRYFEAEYERDRANAYRENLTDRQKYREIVGSDGPTKYVRNGYERRGPSVSYEDSRPGYREYSPERIPSSARGTYTAQDHAFGERKDFKVERTEPYQRGESQPHHGAPPASRTRGEAAHKSDRSARYSRGDQHDGGEGRRVAYRGPPDDTHGGPAAQAAVYRVPMGEDHERYREEPQPSSKGRVGYKMADKYEERWRQEASAMQGPERYGASGVEPQSVGSGRRYHRDDPKQAQPAMDGPRKKSVEIRTSSPESTMHRISPKDRFQTAKEKFQQMERDRHEQEERIEQERLERERLLHSKRTVELHHTTVAPTRRGSLEPVAHASSHESTGWSSEEDMPRPSRGHSRSNGSTGGKPGAGGLQQSAGYRELSPAERYPGLDREPPSHRMMPAKSLSNLVKGYRHSYAEPRAPPVSRSSGRVGLAAVNPY